jgi:hypothetical protein
MPGVLKHQEQEPAPPSSYNLNNDIIKNYHLPSLSFWKNLLVKGLYRPSSLVVCYLFGFLIRSFFQNDSFFGFQNAR